MSTKREDSEVKLINSVAGTGALSAQSLFNIKGWVAIVTGGGTGLGLTTATTLSENGCRVYITGRRLDPLKAAARDEKDGKGAIIPIQADVSTKEGITKLRDEIASKEKFINVLVNNHGISAGSGQIDECEQTAEGISKEMFDNETFETWGEIYKINTASYHFTTFAFLPLLAAAKSIGNYPEPGNIINLSSMSGITKTSQRGQFSYNASKAATISLSKMLATEFARRNLGIRVNCICPGFFPSGMSVFEPGVTSEEFRGYWGIPMGRPGGAVDYAQCIFSLISNQYVTGTDFIIDGGWLLEEHIRRYADQGHCIGKVK